MSTHPSSTLSASDIADLAGVGRSTVSNWRKRHPDFPAPLEGNGINSRFSTEHVVSWLRRHNKPVQALPLAASTSQALDAWLGMTDENDAEAVVADLITWRYVSDAHSPGFDPLIETALQWPQLQANPAAAECLDDAMGAYQERHSDRGPLFYTHRSLSRLFEHHEPVALTLDAITHLNIAALLPAYDAMRAKATRSFRRGYESSTSDELSTLIAALAAGIPGAVHDPVAGTGRLLGAVAADQDRPSITGQDIEYDVIVHANQRLLLAGYMTVTLRQGDALAKDAFEPGLAPVVVAEPPYALRAASGTSLELDPRMRFGTPPRASLDLAWPQIALWSLAEKGRAFVLQPIGSATRGGAEQRIRTALLQAGAIEAMIGLPAGLAAFTQIPLNLWILARPEEARKQAGRVLMIDASKTPGLDTQHIAAQLDAWRTNGDILDDDTARAVSVVDALAERANLDPRRWVMAGTHGADLETIKDSLQAVHATASSVQVPTELSERVQAATTSVRQISVAELERTDSLDVLRPRTRISEKDLGDKGDLVVTAAWVRGQDEPRRIDPDGLDAAPLITQAGDVLVQHIGSLAARVDHEGGRLVASPSVAVIRSNPDVLRPDYLAATLASATNRSRFQGTALQHVRVPELTIPVVSLAEQDAFAATLNEIHELRQKARDLEQDATLASQALVDGLIAGTISIRDTAPRKAAQ